MNNIFKIRETMMQIVEVLHQTNEIDWKNTFDGYLNKLKKIKKHDDLKDYARKVLGIYGGIGSFSDLVLYKNNTVCVSENNKLDSLRSLLYKELQSIIVVARPNKESDSTAE